MNIFKRFFVKISNVPEAVKASIAFFIASLFTKGIAFLTTPIFTRIMSEEDFGKVSLYSTWMQVFGIIAMFCLSYGVFNVGLKDHPDKRDEFSFSVLILSNIITVCFSAILICLYPLVGEFIGLDLLLCVVMLVVFFFQPAYSFWAVRQRYEYKYKWSFFWACLLTILSQGLAVLFVVFSGDKSKVYAKILGSEIVLVAFYFAFYIFIAIKAKFKINCSYWKEVLIFNLPLIPHYLSAFVLNGADKIMISYLVNDTVTAYYSVAYSVASIALIVWHSIDGSLMPYTFKKLEKDNVQSVRKIVNPLLLIFSLGCFLVILLAPEAVKILGTESYHEAVYAIPPIVGGVFFQIQYYLYSNVLYFHKKSIGVMVGSFTAAILNIILNYFCIIKWGYLAAGYTTLVCFAVQACIDYIFMRLVEKRKIYDLKFILLLSLIVIVAAIFSNMLYDFFVIRIVIVAAILITLILLRKKIKNYLFILKEGK